MFDIAAREEYNWGIRTFKRPTPIINLKGVRAMTKPIVSQQFVNSLFTYKGGKLFHKTHPIRRYRDKGWNSRYAGKEAGFVGHQGYIVVGLSPDGKKQQYAAHRIIFLMHHGWMPKEVDHANHLRHDNRIENLRAATSHINKMNLPMRSSNTSGHMGVWWHKQCRKWCAEIKVNGKKKYLGVFINIEDAIAAREAANIEHGYHSNHGKGESWRNTRTA